MDERKKEENSEQIDSEQQEKVKRPWWKKALTIFVDVVLVLFVSAAVFLIVITVSSKKDSDGTVTLFNTQLRFVQSDSMAESPYTDVSNYKIKSIPVKSCVFIDVIPEEEPKREEWLKTVEIGDVLTFKYVYTKQETITHRVTAIEEKSEGGYIITLEGDNKASESGVLKQIIDTSETESSNYIIGRVTGQSYFLGVLIYALRQPLGIALIIIVPCAIIIILNAIRIFRVLSQDKKEKALAASTAKNDEIEELKRQIELLKKNENNKEKEEE